MTDRFFPRMPIQNSRVVRPVSGRVFAWLAILAVGGTILSCGFMASARQHFQAVSMGYEREALRQQAVALENQVRKLDLERARISSPVELEKRARRQGLDRPAPPKESSPAPTSRYQGD
ncbi:MAG TPA: hypothetical protein VJX67_19945 [Blastocatellia bacterium]|nr:hypothetical protein [Blastocatellia bacterium]